MLYKSMKVLFISMLFIVLVVGCSGNNESDSNATSNATTNTQGEGNVQWDGMNLTGYPIVNDTQTVSIFVNKDALVKKPFNEMLLYQQLEEKTNVHVDWIEAPSANMIEQKNLAFASGDLPDAFMNALTGDEAYMYGKQEMLIPLEDLIDEYAPNIKSFLDNRPDVKQAATSPDGHIYGIPRVIEVDAMKVSEKMFINKTWLDQLGLEVPTNAEQFYEVLKAFKEQDPNGNGKADEIPLSLLFGSDWSYDGKSLFGLFGMIDTPEHLLVFDGEVTFTADKPEHKAALEWLHKLYSEGLLDQEIFTQDTNQLFAKGQSSDMLLGAFFGHNGFKVLTEQRENDHYIPLPPMTNANGEQLWNGTPWASIIPSAFNITSQAENPEVLIRWIDTMYEPKTSTEYYFGPFGLNIEENDDGTYSMMPTPEDMVYPEFRLSEGGGTAVGSILSEESEKFDDTFIEKYYYEPVAQVFMPAIQQDNFMPLVVYTEDQMNELSVLESDIKEYVDKMQAKFIVDGFTDEDWEDYIAQLERIGLDQFIQIQQEAYDAFINSGAGQ